ncbi:hypothetical protein JYK22_05215, partial [Nonomuraea sp. RK-328]|nr:hypothetical protein [Nonomuraea sp. RK-328]
MGNSMPEIPPTVRERAEEAGRQAVQSFTREYLAELKAHENAAVTRHAGTAQPARWLADDPCPAWCVGGIDHEDGTHPDDRAHYGPTTLVELVTMEPVVTSYPEQWAPVEASIALDKRYREREARVLIGTGDQTHMWATLDEAERLAGAIIDMVRQARGGWQPSLMPFDPEGKCPDATCANCHPLPGEVSA